MKRKILLIFIAFTLILTLCGCEGFEGRNDALLRSPRPGGEYSQIQQALDEAVSDSHVLKYARSGEYRSAFVIKEMSQSGAVQALAFYSVQKNKEEILNMALAEKDGKDWKITGTAALGGTDIEKLDFGDTDGDGNLEAVVAWSIYGSPETRLSVFNLTGDIPVSNFEKSYSDFCVNDMDENGKDDLLIFTLNASSGSAVCEMYSDPKANEQKPTAQIELSSGMTTIKRFHKTSIEDTPTVFVDAFNGVDTLFTEIVQYSDGKLETPLKEKGSGELTKRFVDLPCCDVNSDGIPEIPIMKKLPNAGSDAGDAYLTVWKSYKKGKLTVEERSVVSADQQYRFKIASAWVGSFTYKTIPQSGETVFYEYSDKKIGRELLRLRTVAADDYKKTDYPNYFVIEKNASFTAIGKIVGKTDIIDLSEKSVKKRFLKCDFVKY